MMDYYLKAPDAETLQSALIAAGVAQLLEGGLAPTAGNAIDIIGPWHEPTGEYMEDEAGELFPVYAPVPGYHANIRSAEPIAWPETVELMEPATPWRVWG